jgi:Rrf2 family protein
MLTKKSKYGLKALMSLAEEPHGRPVLIADLAERHRLPKKFLEAILLELKRHGVLQSRKGKGGGYFLNRNAANVTLGQVIRILDGPLALIPCVSQTAYTKCEECEDEETCGIRLAMKDVRDATARILDNTSLAALNTRVDRVRVGRSRRRSVARSAGSP